MRKHYLRRVGYVLSGMVIMGIGVLAGKDVAFADTGSFAVTGGTEGEDYSYDSATGELKILTSTPITISGTCGATLDSNGKKYVGTKEYINIAADNADVTLKALKMYKASAAQGSSIVLASGISGATIRIGGSGTSELTYLQGYDAPAIQKSDSTYPLTFEGVNTDSQLTACTLTAFSSDNFPAVIGGASGHVGDNIIINSGVYKLYSYNGGGACIGGGYGSAGRNIRINGGKVEATVQNATSILSGKSVNNKYAPYVASAIGGGGNGDGENITITGGALTAKVVVGGNSEVGGGAAIGGGCNGIGKNIVISGGDVNATVAESTSDNVGAGIGGGYKESSSWSSGGSITISGGKVTAAGKTDTPGIGSCGNANKADSSNITITGGTINATGGTTGPGIGGNYSNVNVYISGGTINAVAGTGVSGASNYKADAIGLSAVTKSKTASCKLLNDISNNTSVKLITKTDASLADKKVTVIISKDGNEYEYGTRDMYADSTGSVYLYLPSAYTADNVTLTEAGKTIVNVGKLEWDYTGPYYYKNSDYTVRLKTAGLPEGVAVPADSAYSNNKKSAVPETPYSASVTLSPADGYALTGNTTQTLDWNIVEYPAADLKILYDGKETPAASYYGSVAITAEGYSISNTVGGTYSASYTLKDSGVSSLYFKNSDGYIVKRDTKSLTIEKTPVNISELKWNYTPKVTKYYYKNAAYEVKLSAIPTGAEVVSYTGNTGTETGEYTATVVLKAKDDYSISESDATQTLTWKIEEYPAADLAILYNGAAIADEYSGDVVVTAKNYTISATKTGTYSESYTVTTSGAKTLFFKNSNGYIVERTTEDIIIDRSIRVDLSDVKWNYDSSTEYYYNGKTYSVKLSLTDAQAKGVTVKYTDASKTAVGSYTAKAVITANTGYKLVNADKVPATCDWNIKEYAPAITLKYNGSAAIESGWYKTAVTVTADGHKLRVGESGTFEDSITISKTGTSTLYFQSTGDGNYTTTTGKNISVNIDQTSPTSAITVDGAEYKTISSGKKEVKLNSKAVTIAGADSGGGVDKIEYALYTGTESFTTKTAIEGAGSALTWQTGTTCTLGENTYQAVYVRVTDEAGNVGYASTPLIYNDTVAPAVETAVLSTPETDKENTLDYSFTMNESCNYYYVLKKSEDAAPASLSEIENAVKGGAAGGSGTGTGFSGSFRNLTSNVEYKMYVIAYDDAATLSGKSNPNVSAIKSSNGLATIQIEVPVSDQTMYVKKGVSGANTYDPWNMLRATAKTLAAKKELGTITYTTKVNSEASIITGTISEADIEDGHKGITFNTNTTGSNVGDKQTVEITFNFSESAYKSVSAILTIEVIDKTPIVLGDDISVSDITYGETLKVPNAGDIIWKNGSETVNITTNINYVSDSGYDSSTPPKDAGTYRMIISASNSEYSGLETIAFVIKKKDLSSSALAVKWYLNGEKYNDETQLFADGTTYTFTIKDYTNSDVLTVAYEGDNNKSAVGTYHTKANYVVKDGNNANNYILPNPSTLTWKISEKPQEKLPIDISGIRWKYYKGTSEASSLQDFIYDGSTTYEVEIDEETLPEGIDSRYIKYTGNTATDAGSYKAVASFTVDTDKYIQPDPIELSWGIRESANAKLDFEISEVKNSVKWIYKHGNETDEAYATGEYNEDETELVADGIPYVIALSGQLPSGVSIEYSGVVEATEAGDDYLAVATFIINEEIYNPLNASELTMSLPWRILEPAYEPVDADIAAIKEAASWVYTHGETTEAYVAGTTKLIADGTPYTVSLTGLPAGVTAEYNNTDVEKQDAGEYTAVATLVLDEKRYNPVSEDEDMTITLNWSISQAEAAPVVTPSEVTPAPAVEPAPAPAPAVAQAGTIAVTSGANYKILSASATGGTVEYEGQEKVNKKATSITIPATVVIDNVSYEVTAIKSNAFSGYSKLKKVTIGSKVTKIGSKAFYKCTSLKSVVIPAGVTEIEASAFQGCKKLNKITIKSKVLKKVGKNAIKGINKKATIKCPTKKLAKQYKKKLFKSSTGYKKSMKIK